MPKTEVSEKFLIFVVPREKKKQVWLYRNQTLPTLKFLVEAKVVLDLKRKSKMYAGKTVLLFLHKKIVWSSTSVKMICKFNKQFILIPILPTSLEKKKRKSTVLDGEKQRQRIKPPRIINSELS